VGIAQSCIRRGLDWPSGSISLARVVKCWNRLPGEVVDAAGLSVFKRHLDNARNNFGFVSPELVR